MPNHVTTVCSVTGPEPDVARFVSAHLGAEGFFHSVTPMPQSVRDVEKSSDTSLGFVALRGVVPPERPAWASDVPRYLAGYGMLPQHVRDQASLRAWLETNRPEALTKARQACAALDETGFLDWYEWATHFWGTKWDAYGRKTRAREPGRVVFKFESAWSFPEPVFRRLARVYPLLVFTVASFDEGWNFACEGAFNGPNDFRQTTASAELYERVYGVKPGDDEDEDDEDEDDAAEASS